MTDDEKLAEVRRIAAEARQIMVDQAEAEGYDLNNPPPGYEEYLKRINKEAMVYLLMNAPDVLTILTIMYHDSAPIAINKLYELAGDEAKRGVRSLLQDLTFMSEDGKVPFEEVPTRMQADFDRWPRPGEGMTTDLSSFSFDDMKPN